MIKYKKLNLNPKKIVTSDAITQILCYCGNLSYVDAILLQQKIMLKSKYGPNSEQIFQYILEYIYNFKYISQEYLTYRNNSVKVKHLDKVLSKEFLENNLIVCQTLRHCLVVDGGYYIDKINTGNQTVVACYYKPKNKC